MRNCVLLRKHESICLFCIVGMYHGDMLVDVSIFLEKSGFERQTFETQCDRSLVRKRPRSENG